MTKKPKLLRIDLQTFADPEITEQPTEPTPQPPSDETKNTETTNPLDNKVPYDRFKQKVDEANALKEKLAQFEREQAEKERQALEEQQEYKTLYEKAQEQITQFQQQAVEAKKGTLLIDAGYTREQAERYKKYLDGESDDTLTQSLNVLKQDIPPKPYVDPSLGNGNTPKPEPTDAYDQGKELARNILAKRFGKNKKQGEK